MQPLMSTPGTQNGTVLKARTVQTLGGTKINWWNVSYLRVEEISEEGTQNKYKVTIYWKYKASIKSEYIYLPIGTELYKYFKRYGIVQLGNTYINLHKIITIDEKAKHGPVEKTSVRIVFTDGFQIVETLDVDKWVWWKNTYS